MQRGKQTGLSKFKNRFHKAISTSSQFQRINNILLRVIFYIFREFLFVGIISANHIPHEQYQQYNPPHTGDYNAPQQNAYQVSFQQYSIGSLDS